MSETTTRFPDDFSIDIDGVIVRGRIVRRARWDLAVEIVEPFRSLATSTHVSYLGHGHVPSFDNHQQIEKTAHWMLAGLYKNAKSMNGKMPELRRIWNELLEKLRELERDDPDRPSLVAAERREVRTRFRSAGIDTRDKQREYQKLLTALRKRDDAYNVRRREIIDASIDARPWPKYLNFEQLEPFMKTYAGE